MSYRPITDIWICARPKVNYYGAYPSGFLDRARALLGVGYRDAVLHVCAGRVRDYPFEGLGCDDRTLDLDPAVNPDHLEDAREIQLCRPPWRDFDPHWPAILIDRPYTEEDARHYAPEVHDKLPDLSDLLKRALGMVREGGKVGVLDYLVPRPPKAPETKFTALVGVLCGFNNRMRAFSVFERRVERTPEQRARTRRAITGKSTDDAADRQF